MHTQEPGPGINPPAEVIFFGANADFHVQHVGRVCTNSQALHNAPAFKICYFAALSYPWQPGPSQGC